MFFDLTNLTNKPVLFLFLPFAFAFLLTALILPIYINWLKRLQFGQFIREEGPASHAVKEKTPTTGGLVFIIAVVSSLLPIHMIMGHWNWVCLVAVLVGVLCGILGLIDDLSKFKNRANKGLSASKRLLAEVLIGFLFGLFLIYVYPAARDIIMAGAIYSNVGNSETWVSGSFFVLPSIIFIGLAIFMICATTNSVNLNDGMDGLAAGLAVPIFLTLAIMLFQTHSLSLALIAMACAGTLAAFLLFNAYPAKIFMGDVGSLFIGGLLAALVLSSGLTLWFIPLALIYILETLSVLSQVSYFKLTKPYTPSSPMNPISLALYKLTHKLPGEGKRIFRMAPLHHHFEAVLAEKGIAEWQIVLAFWIVQLLICFIVLAAFSRF